MPTSIPHWIDGARREGAGDRTAPVTDPATGEVTGAVALATPEEVDAAVAAATAAFPAWRDTSLTKRTAVLFRSGSCSTPASRSSPRSSPRARQGPRRRPR